VPKLIYSICQFVKPFGQRQLTRTSRSSATYHYRRETVCQLRTSFSARSLIVHFSEHRICCTTI